MTRHKLGTALLCAGISLVFAALLLFLLNTQEAAQAGSASHALLSKVMEEIGKRREEAAAGQTVPDPYDPAMTEVELDGYGYIGYLSVPSLGLELPVMSEWDYPRLKIAPCRYSGSTKTDDLVIAAHNYDSHFGSLSGLSPGDTVYFVDMDGILSAYEVVVMDVLEPTAIEEMTSGDFDLTLFTCTYGGQSRVTVRCERAERDGGAEATLP